MKVFAISDLHLSSDGTKPMEVFGSKWDGYVEKIIEDWNEKVSEDDVVLVSGDLSWAMKLENAVTDLKPFSTLKGKKIMIKGNHDYWWNAIGRIREAMPYFVFLQNDAVKIGNCVFCGSRGWSVENYEVSEQDKKLVARETERLTLALKNAQKLMQEGDKLVCLIHYPPFNVSREATPFTDLFEKFGVNAVVYGHLHGKDCKAQLCCEKNGIKYYLTSCDILSNKLAEIDLGD